MYSSNQFLYSFHNSIRKYDICFQEIKPVSRIHMTKPVSGSYLFPERSVQPQAAVMLPRLQPSFSKLSTTVFTRSGRRLNIDFWRRMSVTSRDPPALTTESISHHINNQHLHDNNYRTAKSDRGHTRLAIYTDK